MEYTLMIEAESLRQAEKCDQGMAKWYVYELIDPQTDKVFYVGKGSGWRMFSHGTSGDVSNPAKLKAIESIGYHNVIRRKVAEFWDEAAAFACEAERIKEAPNLTNIRHTAPLMKKTPRTVKLPEWLWQWIDSQPGNRPELIEAAIREKHKIGPPC